MHIVLQPSVYPAVQPTVRAAVQPSKKVALRDAKTAPFPPARLQAVGFLSRIVWSQRLKSNAEPDVLAFLWQVVQPTSQASLQAALEAAVQPDIVKHIQAFLASSVDLSLLWFALGDNEFIFYVTF